MRTNITALAVIMAAIGTHANADVLHGDYGMAAASAGSADLLLIDPAYTRTISIDGFAAEEFGGNQPLDANNDVLFIDLAAAFGLESGEELTLMGLGWDLTVETIASGSRLSDASLYFGPAQNFVLTPLFGNTASGAASSSNSVVQFSDFGLADLVLADGILRIEFVDNPNNAPGQFESRTYGTLTLLTNVPAPASLVMVGIGGLTLSRHRH